LKATIGENWIEKREDVLLNKAREMLSSNPNIILLSHTSGKALPVISFVVQHTSGRERGFFF
jgi:selenocysteine lyase/cysteine desulfurase